MRRPVLDMGCIDLRLLGLGEWTWTTEGVIWRRLKTGLRLAAEKVESLML